MVTPFGLICRQLAIVAAVSLFTFFEINPAAAQCQFQPQRQDQVSACLAQLCDTNASSGPQTPYERAQCVARVYENWRIVENCYPPPDDVDRCIRLAYLKHNIEQAAARALSRENFLSAMAFVQCVKDGGDLPTCFGFPPRLSPFPPPDPYLSSVLHGLTPEARDFLYKRLGEVAEVRFKSELASLKQLFAAAAKGPTGQSADQRKDYVFSKELEGPQDPINEINGVLMKGAKISKTIKSKIPEKAFSMKPFERDKPEEPVEEPKREKIHPLLKKWLEKFAPTKQERIVITFRETVQIPRFPEPRVDQPRDSQENKRALERAQKLIALIKSARSAEQKELASDLQKNYDAKVVSFAWLVNGALVVMPLGAVKKLAERKDVIYLEPEQTTDIPPQNANNNDDVDDGRARMVSDPYFNLGQNAGWIGLLDTGMRFSHQQFNQPSNIAFRRDCVNGGANCNSGTSLNPNDDCWDHGTSSAGIITGNARLGNAFRGVTGITLDSFKVYPTSFGATGLCNGGLTTTAVTNAFQRAVAVLDRVIVGEMQGSGNDVSQISAAADAAFDAGAVVIAANGNNGPGASTVNAPANAHKVIGVGDFDVQMLNQIGSQSRGPAPDSRIKPDIQAPTNSETADNGCGWKQNCTTGGSNTSVAIFSGTSGATPYAAGAAALLRNWLRGGSGSIDPGQVYAQLILSGQNVAPFTNTSGAGRLRLPTDGWAWWGKTIVRNGETINIPINVSGSSANTLDVALWWPETAAQQHNDVDVNLVDPAGNTVTGSRSGPSVFERARVNGPVINGTWTVGIRGYRIRTTSQTVYWAAHVRLR